MGVVSLKVVPARKCIGTDFQLYTLVSISHFLGFSKRHDQTCPFVCDTRVVGKLALVDAIANRAQLLLFLKTAFKRNARMSKYYVQSGTMRTVVQAETTRKAALWAVHQAMQQVLPMEGEAADSNDLRTDRSGQDGVAVLSQRVCISERGFDRDDSTSVPTMEVVSEWNDMVVTLDRLEKMLYRAK